MSKEQWKDIADYEGLYQVSDFGRVKALYKEVPIFKGGVNIYPEIIRIASTDKGGYRFIKLSKDGRQKFFKIHRLVAFAFLSNPENKPCINHVDSNRQNNHLSNLEWCTYKENMQHASKAGHMTGNAELVGKLTKNEVLTIKTLKGLFNSRQIGVKFGIHRRTVEDILNGVTWKKV